MPHYIITTPAGALVALRVANTPEQATKDNPYCGTIEFNTEVYPHPPLDTCPKCQSTNTIWGNRNRPQMQCNDCGYRWSTAIRRDIPDLSKLPPGLSNRQKAQELYRQGYTVFQIFPALGVSKQACYKYVEGMDDIKISNINK